MKHNPNDINYQIIPLEAQKDLVQLLYENNMIGFYAMRNANLIYDLASQLKSKKSMKEALEFLSDKYCISEKSVERIIYAPKIRIITREFAKIIKSIHQ